MGSKQIHSRRCNFWHTGIRKRQDHPTEYFVCFEYQRRQTECGFCGDQAGANLYPGELFEDVDGKLVSLQKTTPVNDPHELSMAHFVNRALGDQTQMIADGWQGYVIQNLVENLYRSAETGEVITL